jgi:hypothetical protein
MPARRARTEEATTVEQATTSAVKDMGQLSSAQMVAAQQAIVLAKRLDGEDDGSRAAALSRELRQVMAALSAMAGGRRKKDRVGELEDEVARKRAQRRTAG